MTERVEQWICIKFCVKLEYSSAKTIWMIPKAAAMGNWRLAASSWQHTHSCITSATGLFGETSNHPGDSAHLQPRFGALLLLGFPKTKITFEREETLVCWDSSKDDREAVGDENSVRSQGAYFKGDYGVTVLCVVFLISCIFFNKCFYFSYTIAGYPLERPHIVNIFSKVTKKHNRKGQSL